MDNPLHHHKQKQTHPSHKSSITGLDLTTPIVHIVLTKRFSQSLYYGLDFERVHPIQTTRNFNIKV